MIEILDAVMGRGKTTTVINRVNMELKEKFIILTPYLSEVVRYRKALCVSEGGERFDIVSLDEKESATKSQRFKDAVKTGQSVIATHDLFSRFSEWDLKEMGGLEDYNLIIDETILLVDKGDLRDVDIRTALSSQLIDKIEHPTVEDLNFYKLLPGGEAHIGEQGGLSRILRAVSGKYVWSVGKQNVVFVVPPGKLDIFKSVTIQTYMFKGSETNAWLETFKLPFEHKELLKDGTLKPHDGFYTGGDFQHLLKVYEGKCNDIGRKPKRGNALPLGSRWYSKRTARHQDITRLANNTRTFFRNMASGNRGDMLWTCFEPQMDWIRHNEFHLKDESAGPKTWLAYNKRATNDYKDRHVLAFLINVNQFPEIVDFFKKHKVNFSQDNYSLSILLQWTWRSAIREKEAITLYLPSERMRRLLEKWFMSPLLQILTK